MTASDPVAGFARIRRVAAVTGCAGAVACAIGAALHGEALLRSYLLAFVFWTGVGLGCLGFLMLHHLVGGGWGAAARRILEAGAIALAPMLILFAPLLFDLGSIYPWARPDTVAADAELQHKEGYLNAPFFVARTALAFAAWLGLAIMTTRWARSSEDGKDDALGRRLRLWCGPGLVLYGSMATVVAIDWVMSIEPRWMSTVFGLSFIVGHVLSGLCFVVVVLAFLVSRDASLGIRPEHFKDLGNFMLAFVLLWAYLAFSQFLIIWYGNLAAEVGWYVRRTESGWQAIGVALLVLHFAVPFVILLWRRAKRSPKTLARVAAAILFMRVVEQFWTIMAPFRPEGPWVHWLDVAALVAVGGLWVAFFAWRFPAAAPVPLSLRKGRIHA
jgi:hypothetical protein